MRCLLIIFLISISVNAISQVAGKIRAFGGFALGTEAGINNDGSSSAQLGFTLGGEYFVTDQISAAPSYTYFFKSEIGSDNSVKFSAVNLDGRYYKEFNAVTLYGLFGIAIVRSKVELPPRIVSVGGGGTTVTTFTDGETITDSDAGLNFGGGVIIPFADRLGFNGQIKYQTPGNGQLVLNAGVVFDIN
ncbi:MAG: outer membrane beta-barrel protein [Bacteroidota bacterium]